MVVSLWQMETIHCYNRSHVVSGRTPPEPSIFAYSATHIGGALPRVLIIGEVCSVGRFCKIVEGSVARACNRSPLFVAPTANG